MIIVLQTGGFTVANLIWDMMQDRKSALSLPAVEAYHQGLKVTPKSKKIISIVLMINCNLHCVNGRCIQCLTCLLEARQAYSSKTHLNYFKEKSFRPGQILKVLRPFIRFILLTVCYFFSMDHFFLC